MKEVILIRHAQAQQPASIFLDFGRNLDETGIRESIELAKFLKEKNARPDIIFHSEAVRTTDTTRQIVVSGGLNPSLIAANPKLYNCPFPTLISTITTCTEEGNCLAIVGHNPGISQAASVLALSGHYQLETSGAVCFRFEADHWSEIKEGTGVEAWHYQPK